MRREQKFILHLRQIRIQWQISTWKCTSILKKWLRLEPQHLICFTESRNLELRPQAIFCIIYKTQIMDKMREFILIIHQAFILKSVFTLILLQWVQVLAHTYNFTCLLLLSLKLTLILLRIVHFKGIAIQQYVQWPKLLTLSISLSNQLLLGLQVILITLLRILIDTSTFIKWGLSQHHQTNIHICYTLDYLTVQL